MKIIATVLALALSALAVCAAVTVTNVATDVSPGKVVTISYDLASASALTNVVAVSISTNAGLTFFDTCTNFIGDVGNMVATGTAKQITWYARYDTLPPNNYPNTRVRVWASDDMALIPAGVFQMGSNGFADGFGNDPADASPRHAVINSAFYMDKHEVTSQQWMDVYIWATNNGYAFTNPGMSKAPQHPIHTVSWYDCVKWCNARSQKEGLTPCYYSNAAQTIFLKTGTNVENNAWNDTVKWSANGYRLPTEAEWEHAARGGANNMRFPWSDANTITNARANYLSMTNFPYDLGPNGYNPAFTNMPQPYTSPVGYFAPNGYGLYDMAGNLFECCWDWYSNTYYASSPASDPRGPAAGTMRVMRGGNWTFGVSACRVAFRTTVPPGGAGFGLGLRCVRGL